MTSDLELVRAARAGDRRALDALVTRHEPRVYRFAFRLTGQADDAAEVAQDSLMAMARSLGTFRGEASLSTWLYSVARRLAFRRVKARARQQRTESPLDELERTDHAALQADAPDPEAMVAAHERDAVINRALLELRPAYREVLLLRDVEGLTAPEAARVLGINVRAVKSRLPRARLSLRAALAPALGINEPERDKPGCRHIVEAFSRTLDGDLAPKSCADLEAHLVRCRGCRVLCASLKQALAVCRKAPARDLTAALKRSLRESVRQASTGT